MTVDRVSADLLNRVRSVVTEGDTIWTVAQRKRNLGLEIGAEGILVQTDRSVANGTGPAARAGGTDQYRLGATSDK